MRFVGVVWLCSRSPGQDLALGVERLEVLRHAELIRQQRAPVQVGVRCRHHLRGPIAGGSDTGGGGAGVGAVGTARGRLIRGGSDTGRGGAAGIYIYIYIYVR